ncbi:MAG: iron ABC transporter permease [Spirochaetales bacterium]|nr:iron ABC transporter permease [Spirochaetales bacterium]
MNRNLPAILLFLLLPIAVLSSAAFGAADISILTVIRAILDGLGFIDSGISETAKLILFQIRFPRIMLAAVTGAGLATAGVVFQAVFQNPLAEPYLLGISSGASLGATVAIIFGIEAVAAGVGAITFAAFLGSLLTILLVLMIGGRTGGDFGSLLLGGIAIGYIFQAAISFLMMLNRDQTDRIVFWMMGSFASATWMKVGVSFLVVFISIILINMNSVKLNIISLGADEAHSLGVNPERTGLFFLAVSCLLTAAVVSVSGIIGFVGLIVPHLLRLFTGADHRKLLPASAAGGACLMIIADIAARSLMVPKEIPVGVITALIGGPFFLIMLRKQRRKSL